MGNNLGFWDFFDEVGVVVIAGTLGTVVMLNFSPGWFDVVLPHHPLSPFMIHLELKCHSILTILRMSEVNRVDLINQYLVFGGLLGGVVEGFSADPQDLSHQCLNVRLRQKLNLFFPA